MFGAFLVHAAILSLAIFGNRWDQTIAPPEREIPVEVIVEAPKAKPPEAPAPTPQPEFQTHPLDEEPAVDAPRKSNDDKIERKAPDEASRAPTREDTAKAPGEEAAAEEAATPTLQNPPRPAEQPAQPAPASETLTSNSSVVANSESAEAPPPRTNAAAPPEKLATFVGQPFPTWSKGGRFSTFDPLPDVEFGSAAAQTAIAGGKAKSTYLTVLYGMIMSHVPKASSAHEGSEGEIVFVVDGAGNLVQRQISRSSGSRELDATALDAVGEAAPFPAPPQGLPVRLRFTYGAK